jgi:hypothetical protein
VIIFRRLLPLAFFSILTLIAFWPSVPSFLQNTNFDFSPKSLIRPVVSQQDEFIVPLVRETTESPYSSPINWSIKTNEQCITCHNGIEAISDSHPPEIGCVVCHGGNENSQIKEEAHLSLIYDPVWGVGKKNPSHLKLADKSCGQNGCHSSSYFPDQNHVSRLKKSMMGTLAGVISGLRYQWAAQVLKSARYGVYSVENSDFQGEGLPFLESIPFFSKADWRKNALKNKSSIKKGKLSHHIADNLLRKSCFQCHLDSPPPPGIFRGQGCAACHMPYSKNGFYTGNDLTIDKTQAGHASKHKFEALPPNSTCITCHRIFANKKNLSSINQSGGKSNALLENNLFPGQGFPTQDVHFEKGMDCIDCHTSNDIMGDGNIYSKQHEAVEIRCQTCHGTYNTFPEVSEVFDPNDPVILVSKYYLDGQNQEGDILALSEREQKLSNVKMIDNKLSVIGKRTGKIFPIPMIHQSKTSHAIKAHQDKLECSACHSQWVPKCSGCHLTFSQKQEDNNGTSWVKQNYQLSVEKPILMIGPRGKVTPMLAQPKRRLTVLDKKGNPIPIINSQGDWAGDYLEKTFLNPRGYSGSHLAFSNFPHTVSSKTRSCVDCHMDPETLGLGAGKLILGNDISGKSDAIQYLDRSAKLAENIDASPDAYTTIKGQPIAGTTQESARPFNQEEISRILKVGNCIPCHERPEDKIYQNMEKSYKFAGTNKHRQLRQKILKAR